MLSERTTVSFGKEKDTGFISGPLVSVVNASGYYVPAYPVTLHSPKKTIDGLVISVMLVSPSEITVILNVYISNEIYKGHKFTTVNTHLSLTV